RAVDVNAAWAAATGKPRIPQAGLALTQAFADRLGTEGVDALQAAMEKALATVLADPAAAGALVAEEFGMPAPVIAKAISSSNLAADRASVARADLVAFFEVLAAVNPAILGGKLP